jgi:hypothetical protein
MEKQTQNYGPLPFLERDGLFVKDIPIHVSDELRNKLNKRVGNKKGPIILPIMVTECILFVKLYSHTNKQTPWSESASELYRPSDRR